MDMAFQRARRWVLAALAASVTAVVVCAPNSACALPIDYDIVYVRAPRFGNDQNSLWPDMARPLTPDAGDPDGGFTLVVP